VAAQLVASRVVLSSTELISKGPSCPRDAAHPKKSPATATSVDMDPVESDAFKGNAIFWTVAPYSLVEDANLLLPSSGP
jgi:hypothetical protein